MYSKDVGLTYKKREGIYANSTRSLTFNPETLEAFSYKWWRFVAKIEGKVIFNNYSYSISTTKHQHKIRSLLYELGIKIDLFLPLPEGINSSSLAELILTAEEHLCDKYLHDQIKKQERYQRAKKRKQAKDIKTKLVDYLENNAAFRDYEIKDASRFGTYNAIAVHTKIENKDEIEHRAADAINTFCKDGFTKIVFYVEGLS